MTGHFPRARLAAFLNILSATIGHSLRPEELQLMEEGVADSDLEADVWFDDLLARVGHIKVRLALDGAKQEVHYRCECRKGLEAALMDGLGKL